MRRFFPPRIHSSRVQTSRCTAGYSADTALCLFRVAQESLRNVARHAGASAVEVSLRKVDGGIEMAVHDNGAGFDSAEDRAATVSVWRA